MSVAVLFTGEQTKPAKGTKPKSGRRQNQLIMQQLDGMLSALTESNSIELIAEVLDTLTIKVILSAELDYFKDRSASEIIDGEFHVLGKVIRVVQPDSGETINLLRKTSFARFPRKILNELQNAFVGAEEMGIKFPELITEIEGPALQVVPIAIFI